MRSAAVSVAVGGFIVISGKPCSPSRAKASFHARICAKKQACSGAGIYVR
jgi:hypothetical protein